MAVQATDHWAPWGHMGWAGSWFMWIFWLALLLFVIFAIRWFSTNRNPGVGGSPDAESVLKRRHAAGEIDEQTFKRMRDELRK
jgi:putative membrane protein